MKKIIILLYVVVFVSSPSSFAQITELQKLLSTYKDSKLYNEVSWLTSHNSFAYYDPIFSRTGYINPNQRLDIKNQLLFGVRSFMIDLYYKDNNPSMTAYSGEIDR